MLLAITRAAHRLDHWLQARLGRPYNVILTVGLTIEIIRRLAELPEAVGKAHRLIDIALLAIMNVALLIHQLGEMAERAERRLGRAKAPRSGNAEMS